MLYALTLYPIVPVGQLVPFPFHSLRIQPTVLITSYDIGVQNLHDFLMTRQPTDVFRSVIILEPSSLTYLGKSV
jgi:hypothetical protein